MLIPKKNGAECLNDFTPISLIGSMYKIIAKVLSGSILKVLPSIIPSSQGAFVHRRHILNGVLIVSKCIHSRVKDEPDLLCKWDLEKAYDRVDWTFLSYML